MPARQPAPVNQLLAALPDAEGERLREHLRAVALNSGEILCEPGETIRHIYFPDDSLVALLAPVDRHPALGVALVGKDGMVGLACALGVGCSHMRALVQGSGSALRIDAAAFRHTLQRSPCLHAALQRYADSLMAQIAQTAACNRFHLVEARLARWLLMTRDRIGPDRLHLTHAFLGHMLGVRREGVTQSAQALKQRGLIDYRRGTVVIVDGRGLEAAACSCYAQLGKLQPSSTPARPSPGRAPGNAGNAP